MAAKKRTTTKKRTTKSKAKPRKKSVRKKAGPSRMPAQLQQSYLHGKVAARIRWGTPGAFNRCVRQAQKHGVGMKSKGMCANLYKKATGRWPGKKSAKGRKR